MCSAFSDVLGNPNKIIIEYTSGDYKSVPITIND